MIKMVGIMIADPSKFSTFMAVLLTVALSENSSFAIENGFIPDKAQYPVVERLVRVQSPMGDCSGILLNEHIVLSAAHCFTPAILEGMTRHTSFEVSQMGEVFFFKGSPVPSAASVMDMVIHSEQRVSDGNGGFRLIHEFEPGELGDLAVLWINRPSDVSEPISHFQIGFDDTPTDLSGVTAFGYGRTDGSDAKSSVENARAFHFRSSLKRLEKSHHIDTYQLSREDGGLCFGDSGGPTFFKNADNQWHLIGIASRIFGSRSWWNPFGKSNPCADADFMEITSLKWHTVWLQQAIAELYQRNNTVVPSTLLEGRTPEF